MSRDMTDPGDIFIGPDQLTPTPRLVHYDPTAWPGDLSPESHWREIGVREPDILHEDRPREPTPFRDPDLLPPEPPSRDRTGRALGYVCLALFLFLAVGLPILMNTVWKQPPPAPPPPPPACVLGEQPQRIYLTGDINGVCTFTCLVR